NRLEAEKLLGMEITTLEEAKQSAKDLTKLGCHSVVVKGGHIGTANVASDILYSRDGGFQLFEQPRLERTTDHGTGCSFSAAIAAYLAKGLSIPDAVKNSKGLVWHAIKYGLPVGEGHGPVNPLALLYKKAKFTDLL
ncbi:MAG: bifunctional hydroxymethylpyrimidine kinase/phosphomethylpyrimidine kinase, partial [Candidatus Korarchaeota archaeon]|nr:bifunctional hydroxymethylpyrimidine kinase/phosphomethylpyrimidine kinase [Candidatus Korarchaeota archaeon]NIU85194.1 bifunctional hydroxymethylpyrimidine kinase/phosphomethylpyrimidine kinase [Candidatus Thorarchaeota archaeon]NIW15289.1 bifunctional hydroxymethylpyrimidine kinase/phosphomethylpyrimidine kinase [Candidatus Thorarchaeota archaeon]NIW53256.1 bifunctional hydroxymethylpyrimidine kinase/phosphomethylpyrimidine kinase [Candidatus Korarchaeota archaeon]